MKNLKTIALAIAVTISTIATAQIKKVNNETSTIEWVGKKVTGQHSGNIAIKDGNLVFKSKKLIGGNFVVDMTKLTVTDLKSGKGKESLEGHLKADDFFGTEKYPTAKLVFKTIADKGNGTYTITADLTIKTSTNPVTFDLVVAGNTAKTTLAVNRTLYDIKYGSGSFFEGLGDKVIYDNFDLTVALAF